MSASEGLARQLACASTALVPSRSIPVLSKQSLVPARSSAQQWYSEDESESEMHIRSDPDDSDFLPSDAKSSNFSSMSGGSQASSSGQRSSSKLLRGRRHSRRERKQKRARDSKHARRVEREAQRSMHHLVEGAEASDDGDLDGEEEVDVEEAAVPDAELSDASSGESDEGRDHTYQRAWCNEEGKPLPGESGFRKYAEAEIVAHVPDEAWRRGKCPPMQSHQEAVALLLHPRSPVKRLLVDQPTGAGKTRSMIAVLDQLFHDRRPKVPIFPRAAVCRNFYEELLRWPSSYRDFFSCVCPAGAALASGLPEGGDWRTRRHDFWSLSGISEAVVRLLCNELRDTLELKGAILQGRFRSGFRQAFRKAHPGEPLPPAPLRALSYASAGGHHTKFGPDGQPLSALLKFGYRGGTCVYAHKIVLLDEAHNLVRTQTKYTRHLANLRKLLHSARNSVVCGFTGTPMPDDPASGWQLLQTIKGRGIESHCNEGFLVSMCSKRPPLFPRVHPRGFPDTVMDAALRERVCMKVPLGGEALKAYDLKLKAKTISSKLQPYCNTGSHCCTFHGARKAAVLNDPVNWMPKLSAIAAAVCRRREKAVILISRQGGYKAMLALLQRQAARAKRPFKVADAETGLAEFNSPANARGERFLVLVADSGKFSEGTSFHCVRCLYLADVPSCAMELQQQVGRVARMFGHQHLNAQERAVSVVMPTAIPPPWACNHLGAWCLRACNRKELPGTEVIDSAQALLECLKSACITSLGDLKSAVDFEAELDKQASESGDGCAPAPLSKQSAQRLLQGWGAVDCCDANTVVASLQLLRKSRSLEKVCAHLASGTVDEEFTERLCSQLALQVPALTELREIAIRCDRRGREQSHTSPVKEEEAEHVMDDMDLDAGALRANENESDEEDSEDAEIAVEESRRMQRTEDAVSNAQADTRSLKSLLEGSWKDFVDEMISCAGHTAATSSTIHRPSAGAGRSRPSEYVPSTRRETGTVADTSAHCNAFEDHAVSMADLVQEDSEPDDIFASDDDLAFTQTTGRRVQAQSPNSVLDPAVVAGSVEQGMKQERKRSRNSSTAAHASPGALEKVATPMRSRHASPQRDSLVVDQRSTKRLRSDDALTRSGMPSAFISRLRSDFSNSTDNAANKASSPTAPSVNTVDSPAPLANAPADSLRQSFQQRHGNLPSLLRPRCSRTLFSMVDTHQSSSAPGQPQLRQSWDDLFS